MKVYKVVYNHYGKLFSACRNDAFPNDFRVEYTLGVEVKPNVKDTMLFAFTDIDEARRFRDSLWTSEVSLYEAETPSCVKNIVPQNIDDDSISDTKKRFTEFWLSFFQAKTKKKKIDKKGKHPQAFNYKSSVCCPSLKLIKEVN